jgi:prevent-host-death family protein
MAEVEISSLQQDTSRVVARAAAGELVTITDRGRPVAQLTPIPRARLDALIAVGQARPARGSLAELPAPMRRGGMTVSDALRALRDDPLVWLADG